MTASASFAQLAATAQTSRPLAAIVLGSGMGCLARRFQPLQALPFVEVPDLSAATVPGHSGRLTLAEWADRCVLVFEGRLHFYECQNWRSVTAPIRAAHFLGARVLLLTNAAGGIHPALTPGTLMALRAHVLWNQPHSWRQLVHNPQPLSAPYSVRLRCLLGEAAAEHGIPLAEGVYAAVTGPSYETPAEVRALRVCGADAVGMSTAREAQTAWELGMACAAVSLITNRACGLGNKPLHHDEVLTSAARQAEILGHLIEGFLRKL